MPQRPDVVAFDVIETLFPIEPLAPRLEALGLSGALLQGWFAASLRDSFALAAIGDFRPLRAVMGANLDDLLARHGRSATEAQKAHLLDGMGQLPAHAEAAEAMDLLRGAGLRLLALSNGAVETTEKLLHGAGLRERVAEVVSVEEVRLSKPRREVYARAAMRAGVPAERMLLVAAHPWDVNGARAAGLMGGFVARGRPFPAILPAPEVQGASLPEVARAILAMA